MNRKGVYTLTVILMTVVCAGSMLYGYKSDHMVIGKYGVVYTNGIENEGREYMGYIFNDYNKTVNIDYVDKIYKASDERQNVVNAISLSALNAESTKDNIRLIMSERIIEKRAIKDEILKNCAVNAIASYGIGDFDSSIELNEKVELLNLMRNLNQNDMIQFKRLFDRQSGENEVKNILNVLNSKMPGDEYAKLSNLVSKYRKIFKSSPKTEDTNTQ